jgi:hypothetical protein
MKRFNTCDADNVPARGAAVTRRSTTGPGVLPAPRSEAVRIWRVAEVEGSEGASAAGGVISDVLL